MANAPRTLKARFRAHLIDCARNEYSFLEVKDWLASTDQFSTIEELVVHFVVQWIVIPKVKPEECLRTIAGIVTWIEDESGMILGPAGTIELFKAIEKGEESVMFWVNLRIVKKLPPGTD